MKKLILGLATLAMIAMSCQDDSNEVNLPSDEIIESNQKGEKQCFTMDKLEENLANDPTLAGKMAAIEEQTKSIIEQGNFKRLENGKIIIPIVFHVIYRTASENVPLSVLEAQVDALNDDFNLRNPNRGAMPAEFAPVEANVSIDFEIEDVIRVENKKKRQWRPDDSMKFSSSGGSDVVNPQEFLNVWVVNYMPYRGGQILGYAQFPGGNLATDGVVMSDGFVGADQRTLTHEVGHYLNLRHIWGDGGCSADDFVADTPLSSQNYSNQCPPYPTASCGSNDMTMNFMSYVRDECMYMFSNGQKARMEAVFAPGAFRATMAD